MDHNLTIFVVLYGLSMVPWLFAFKLKARNAQVGLAIIDITLTIAAYIFLAKDIGWWVVLIFFINAGLGEIFESFKLNSYDNLSDRQRSLANSKVGR